MADVDGGIEVEVVYAADPGDQALLRVCIPPRASVGQAIELSGIRSRFPEIDLKALRVGVFGKLTTLDAPLRAGDRVEIYRPLIADPKQVRRERARHERRKGRSAR